LKSEFNLGLAEQAVICNRFILELIKEGDKPVFIGSIYNDIENLSNEHITRGLYELFQQLIIEEFVNDTIGLTDLGEALCEALLGEE